MLKDKEKERAYRRKYDLARYHKRRANAIAQLGGKCSKCGSDKELQIDHIDPELKTLDVGKLWGVAEKRFQEEIAKCQLLCQPCHSLKTIYDNGWTAREHGNIAMYQHAKCRCGPCRKAKSEANKEYQSRHRLVRPRTLGLHPSNAGSNPAGETT